MFIWFLFIMGGAAFAGFLVLAILLLIARKRTLSVYELGQISDQWISQQRAHDRDANRL